MNWPPALHISGYKVECIDDEKSIGIQIVVKLNEKTSFQKEVIRRWPNKPENYPLRQRLLMLATAFCRFLNSGGEITALSQFAFMAQVMQQHAIPPDWTLWSTLEDEYIFVRELRNGKKEYLRVVENEFTEALDEKQFYELQTGQRAPILVEMPTNIQEAQIQSNDLGASVT